MRFALAYVPRVLVAFASTVLMGGIFQTCCDDPLWIAAMIVAGVMLVLAISVECARFYENEQKRRINRALNDLNQTIDSEQQRIQRVLLFDLWRRRR